MPPYAATKNSVYRNGHFHGLSSSNFCPSVRQTNVGPSETLRLLPRCRRVSALRPARGPPQRPSVRPSPCSLLFPLTLAAIQKWIDRDVSQSGKRQADGWRAGQGSADDRDGAPPPPPSNPLRLPVRVRPPARLSPGIRFPCLYPSSPPPPPLSAPPTPSFNNSVVLLNVGLSTQSAPRTTS